MGRKVGVEGREEGVGIELVVLVVAFVLVLLRPSVDTDSLDCGRRMVGMILCDKALDALLLLILDEGESMELEDTGRNAVGAAVGGLEVRRLSLSISFAGDGESSMIKTQPDVSPPPGVRLLSASKSTLCLRDFGMVAKRSSCFDETDRDDEVDGAGEGEAFAGNGGGGIELAAGRVVTLPIRKRGTRV